jgi:Icc-related predicted phosphoesterase
MLNQIQSYDLVIVAGDLLDLGSDVEHEVQSLVVERYLSKFKSSRRTLVSSGNHDAESGESSLAADPPYAAQWMQHLRHDGHEVDGMCVGVEDKIKISICPWWQTDRQRDELHQKLKEDQKQKGTLWVWIHHVPPDQSPLSWTGKDFKGEPSLNEWIAELEPDLVFCGHIHNAPFKQGGAWNIRQGKTWIFNAGRELGEIPTHLIVDLVQKTVEWRSSAGPERCDLNTP